MKTQLNAFVAIVVFNVLLFSSVFADSTNLTFYEITKKNIHDGLPHSDILGISADKKGFLWLVTRSGLCRYDGYIFLTHTVKNSLLNYNRMNSMIMDDNFIWIGTSNGVIVFNIEKEIFNYNFSGLQNNNFENSECKLLYLDKTHRLWFIRNNVLGYFKVSSNNITTIRSTEEFYPPLAHLSTTDVKQDRNGNIWISTNNGLFQFVDSNGKLLCNAIYNTNSSRNKLYDNYINTMHFDWNGNLCLGSYQSLQKLTLSRSRTSNISEVVRVDFRSFNQFKIHNTSNTIDNNRLSIPNVIVHDDNKQLWVGTQTGIIMFQPEKPDEALLIQESNSKHFALSSEMITSLYVNRQGTLFIGSIGGGLNILDTKQKKIRLISKDLERPQFSLVENTVRAVVEEDNGDLWVGMQSKGLCKVDYKTRKISNYDFLGNNINAFNTKNFIRTLYLEDNRYLWIGGLDKVFCFDILTKKEVMLDDDFYQKTQIRNGYFTDITSDNFGNLWMASWGRGIMVCKRGMNSKTKFREIQIIDNNISKKNHLSSNSVNSFCVSSDNRILASTQNGFEIIQMNSSGEIIDITSYSKEANKSQQLSNSFVWDIIQIDKNSFYMGTLGGGVNKVTIFETGEKSKFGNYKAEVLDSAFNLKDLNVECMIRDKNDNLWVAGSSLLFYNEKKHKYEPYDFSMETTLSTFKVGSCCLGKSGRAYFGTTQGLIFFNPAEIKPNMNVPRNEITELFIHNLYEKPDLQRSSVLTKALSLSNRIELSHRQNNFTIWFSALQYINPQNIKYKYMLEGYDDKWIETTGKKPFASYLNLKYGKYKLKVISSNNDGVWNMVPRELSIEIQPPFYQTYVAYLLYLLIVYLIIRYFIKSKSRFYSIKKDLEIEKEREIQNEKLFQEQASFFTHLSHELRTPLTLIYSPIKEIIDNEKYSRLGNQLNFVYKNVEKMLYMVNKMIEFRKVESDSAQLELVYADIHSFVKQISAQFNDWAERKHITYTVNISDKVCLIWFDVEKIESIISNLLTNSFKYTPEFGSIEILISDFHKDISMNNLRNIYNIGQALSPGLHILISDNGIGIQTNKLSQIFDYFYRENIQYSEGFGVGLSLVKRLTELHRAYLQISSENGSGTEVMLTIATADDYYSENEKKTHSGKHIQRFKHVPDFLQTEIEYNHFLVDENTIEKFNQNRINAKILIIEDDKQIRNYLRVNLSRWFSVIDISKGNNAIGIIRNNEPDLIICDYMLPDMDGLELTRRLKADVELAHIPIIMITAKTNLEMKIRAIDEGVDQFIEKPFLISVLISHIFNILSNRKSLINKLSNNVIHEAFVLTNNQKDSELLNKVIKLIKNNMENSDFLVDSLCADVGLARSVFYAKIKQISGKTPNELIRDIRLEEAILIMANNGLSISEAAYKIGMTPTYFSKSFKQKYKKTPSEYLQEKRK